MFKFTVEGCTKAKKYLKETNQYHLVEKEKSADGWTVVALANRLKRIHAY